MIVIVEKDSLLTVVTIKPLALRLEVDIGEIISGVSRFTNTGRAINPSPTDIFGLTGVDCCDLIGVKGLLDLEIILDLNISVGDSFLWSHLDKLLISSGEVSLLIEASGLNSKSPRSVEACILFVAILICAIIKFNKLEVRNATKLFKKCLPLLFLSLDKVLDMASSVFTFL